MHRVDRKAAKERDHEREEESMGRPRTNLIAAVVAFNIFGCFTVVCKKVFVLPYWGFRALNLN